MFETAITTASVITAVPLINTDDDNGSGGKQTKSRSISLIRFVTALSVRVKDRIGSPYLP